MRGLQKVKIEVEVYYQIVYFHSSTFGFVFSWLYISVIKYTYFSKSIIKLIIMLVEISK